MADLVTHLASALAWKAATRGRMLPVFAAGTAFPDLLGRGPGLALSFLRQAGWQVPEQLVHLPAVVHMPVGMACVALLGALPFRPEERAAVAQNLLGGALLHLAVDLLQRHLGAGYMLLYPLSVRQFELGWLGPEATVPWAPWLLVASALAWWMRVGRGLGRGGREGPPAAPGALRTGCRRRSPRPASRPPGGRRGGGRPRCG